MEHIYIDESGSMTVQHKDTNPYFVISLVRCQSPDKVKTLYKRFVESHMKELREADTGNRMFVNGRFKELKGSMFTPELKREFISYFCRDEKIQVFYIVMQNDLITGHLYDNTARAFNYVIKLMLETSLRRGLLPDDDYCIQLDERNEKTETRYFLENYLNTELQMSQVLSSNVTVKYFDSAQNRLIQLADVFANIYYSHLRTGNYEETIQQMKDAGCLPFIFRFPLCR